MVDHVAERANRERFADFVLPTLRDPAEVWLQARVRADTGRVEYNRMFVGAYEGQDIAVVVQERRYGLIPYTFFPSRAVNGQRRDILLYRRR